MNEQQNVFELDVDDMMAELERLLTDRGYEVREQVPAGVWWFRTDRVLDETAGDIAVALEQSVRSNLRVIEQ
ncbi:MAG TPA: hypothetical protein VKX16_04875 [Chloroflexota bacterium]|nr:hypothetical protein [Chloroflexota bacterium]